MTTAKEFVGPVEILLVEDSATDALLTCEAIKRANISHNLHRAIDGIEAMQFLRREEGFSQAPRPHVVLLDLNMPRMGGHQVLEEIKADTSLRRVPVIVLTTSDDDRDIDRAYDRSANCYLTKPVDLGDFVQVMESIKRFCLPWVSLPTRD